MAAWVGSTNLGDELAFAGLRHHLVEVGASVTVVSVSPEQTRVTHGVEAVGARDLGGMARAVGDADALVLGGGGLLQDHTSVWNLPYHLHRVWAAQLVRTPVGVIGIGAGPLTGRLGRHLVRASLGRAAVCTGRDTASAELLAGLGVPGVTVAADLAFALPVPEVAVEDSLVVALRPWTGRRGVLPAGRGGAGRTVPDWFVPEMAQALDQASRRTGLGARFVALQADRDGPLHDRIAEAMTTTATVVRPTVADVVDEVARGRVVVGMRYHAVLAAVLGGRSAVALAYDTKVTSLAADVGPGVIGLPWSRSALTGLPGAVVEAAASDGAMVADARARLRLRERANRSALERLMEGRGP